MRNAVELSHRRWDDDVAGLIRELERVGIAPAEPGAEASAHAADGVGTRTGRVAVEAVRRFLPNLAALVRRPRAVLAKYRSGRGSDLPAAAAFFSIALLAGLAILLAAYTPQQPVASFVLAVFVVAILCVLAVSLPLWIGWAAVGARRHYTKLLVVLLHQSGV